jgi:hypothetical protein
LELGLVLAVDSEGRTLWIVDAHRDNGERVVVWSDEMLSAFLELERIAHELAFQRSLAITVIEIASKRTLRKVASDTFVTQFLRFVT